MEVARNLKLKTNQKCLLWYHWGAWKYKRLRVWRDLRNGFSPHHHVTAFQSGLAPGSVPMVRKTIPLWNYIHFPISTATSGTAFMEDQKIESLISIYVINYNDGVHLGVEKGKETCRSDPAIAGWPVTNTHQFHLLFHDKYTKVRENTPEAMWTRQWLDLVLWDCSTAFLSIISQDVKTYKKLICINTVFQFFLLNSTNIMAYKC